MDTLELTVTVSPRSPWSEIFIAELAEKGFDSFVETDTGFMAYADAAVDGKAVFEMLADQHDQEFEYSLNETIIPHQNWNEKWEADFHPVDVEDYACIVAPFHDVDTGAKMRVVIQPQMSFGTGHHQTTWLMTKALFELDAMPERVLDMGTGTGVLAIVAEKLGAKHVLAIDIEEWSAENARENAERNACTAIECVWGDVDKIGDQTFGLIIANINKNILKSHMETYVNALENNGTLLLSGFFGADVDEMVAFTEQFQLTKERVLSKDEWAALQFKKTM